MTGPTCLDKCELACLGKGSGGSGKSSWSWCCRSGRIPTSGMRGGTSARALASLGITPRGESKRGRVRGGRVDRYTTSSHDITAIDRYMTQRFAELGTPKVRR